MGIMISRRLESARNYAPAVIVTRQYTSGNKVNCSLSGNILVTTQNRV